MGNTLAVIIASLGRPDWLEGLLGRLAQQTVRPGRIILSLETSNDAPKTIPENLFIEVVYGPRGSSVQRNRALDLLGPEIDIVAIIDDDYVPSRYFVEKVCASFASFSQASGLGGLLLADGARNGGITFADARKMVDGRDANLTTSQSIALIDSQPGVYGCNMAFRMSHVGRTRFDETVPLYGWLEDTDFGARLPGPFLYTDGFWGVHCAEKAGREGNGRRLGYSQVANAIHFWRKGTLSTGRMLSLVLRPVLANLFKLVRPEPWIDRSGRMRGNLIALGDLARGRLDPQRILNL